MAGGAMTGGESGEFAAQPVSSAVSSSHSGVCLVDLSLSILRHLINLILPALLHAARIGLGCAGGNGCRCALGVPFRLNGRHARVGARGCGAPASHAADCQRDQHHQRIARNCVQIHAIHQKASSTRNSGLMRPSLPLPCRPPRAARSGSHAGRSSSPAATPRGSSNAPRRAGTRPHRSAAARRAP